MIRLPPLSTPTYTLFPYTTLLRAAPGLSAQVSVSGTSIPFAIRAQGLTLGQSAPGVVPYFAEFPEFATQFYDLEGVQVLKGPQGTLFGRNTTGGAILFSPRQPDNEFGG